MQPILDFIRKFIPKDIFRFFQPFYHYALAFVSNLIYGFPAKKLFVIAVTGTKGKTTTTEIVADILVSAGKKVAVGSTVRFAIGKESRPNLYKMTMPGRFFFAKFLGEAIAKGATHAVLEASSEGHILFRDRFFYPDVVVVTGIEPEHIESHGGYEKYLQAKFGIVSLLKNNGKKNKVLVLNGDDKEAVRFRALDVEETKEFKLKNAEPLTTSPSGSHFTLFSKKISSPLPGEFNVRNILAAALAAKAAGISEDSVVKAVSAFKGVRGRMEKVEMGQPFEVVVDYAHTPGSLTSIYKVYEGRNTICLLSGTGGGRDRWKRKAMGEIADKFCGEIIMTDEDPYDEDPEQIVKDIREGIKNPRVEVVLDRRAAMRAAFLRARTGDAVLITGKGTDPYIMGVKGKKTPWDDAGVAKEELKKLGYEKALMACPIS